jgi:hypothetical protein
MKLDLDFLLAILIWFGANGTIAMLVALIVDIFKRFGLVKDGTSGTWSAALNLFGMIAFAVFYFLNPAISFGAVDAQLQLILNIAQIFLGFFWQLKLSSDFHFEGQYARLPILGYSLSETAYQNQRQITKEPAESSVV